MRGTSTLLLAAIARPCFCRPLDFGVSQLCTHTPLHTSTHACLPPMPRSPSPQVSPRPYPPHPYLLCLVLCLQDSHLLHSDGTVLEADRRGSPLLAVSGLLGRKGQQHCLLCIPAGPLLWGSSVSALRHHPPSTLAWPEAERRRHC